MVTSQVNPVKGSTHEKFTKERGTDNPTDPKTWLDFSSGSEPKDR
jgi:hypothetical protein